MTTFLKVRQFGQISPDHRATFASLPATLRHVETGTPDIALSAPDEASVAESLALSPKAIVIADPAAVGTVCSRQLTEASTLVVPALGLQPSLRQIRADWLPKQTILIHSRLEWQGDTQAAIFEHLAGLANVVGDLVDPRILCSLAGGHVGSASTKEGVEIIWSGLAKAPSSSYCLDISGLTERLEVRADLDGSARSLFIRRSNAGGSFDPTGSFETGLRRFWRDVAGFVRQGEPTTEWKDIAVLHGLAHRLASMASGHGDKAA
jgi:hypothetical protein